MSWKSGSLNPDFITESFSQCIKIDTEFEEWNEAQMWSLITRKNYRFRENSKMATGRHLAFPGDRVQSVIKKFDSKIVFNMLENPTLEI